MFENYIQQLKDRNAAVRRDAIIALGKLADPRALSYLGQIYKNDPDPALRELAAKAGRHIQKLRQQAQATSSGPAAPSAPAVEPPPPAEPDNRLPDILKNYSRSSTSRGSSSASTQDPLAMSSPLATPSMITSSAEPQQSNLPNILQNYTRPGAAAPRNAVESVPENEPDPGVSPGRGSSGRAESAPPEINVANAKPKPVSKREYDRARDHLRHAFDAKVRGAEAEALAELARALRTDPDIANESSAQGLAASLVGGQGKDSIRIVLERAAEYSKGKPGAAAVDSEAFGMVLALVGLFAANLFFTVFYLVSILPMTFVLPNVAATRAISPNDVLMLRNLASEIMSSIVKENLGQFARTSGIFLGSTVFQMIVVYMIGTFMGGTGAFIRFVRVLATFGIFTYLWIGAIFALLYFSLTSGSMPMLTSTIQFFLPGVAFSGLAVLGIEVFLVSRVQKFSILHGAASVIFGSILAGIIASIFGLFRATGSLR